jgi:hypothetical protein
LKLAHLLAQYLYSHKRLDLPGIGSFTLVPSTPTENDRQKQTVAEIVNFENNPAIQQVPELISFISEKTGKMKALAISDLESHLELVQQFLNISKPYTIEGIGTLVKTTHGELEFTPGPLVPEKERQREPAGKETHSHTKNDSTDAKYQKFLASPAEKTAWKRPVIALLIICGIGLAIWGGYTISTQHSTPQLAETPVVETTPAVDTLAVIPADTVAIKKEVVIDNYKFVLEVAQANRAFKRYNQLKQTNLARVVQMETADSVQYKLFVMLPASTDTTRAIDSLTVFLGKKVYIEHQN